MIKILLLNILFLIILGFGNIIFIYDNCLEDRVHKAFERLASFESNPHYNEFTQKIGNLPQNDVPTNYLKIKLDQKKIKIGFFGDSHTMGSEVSPGDDFPSVLQNILGNKYQIINFGQEGYNSNQVYLMAKYFSKKFDLDIIIFGPRGFYTERATTFNHYWSNGNIPYSRFVLEQNKLKEIAVPGKTKKEQISNYYSVIPSWDLVMHDHVAPSFLKLYDLLFGKEILNLFVLSSSQENIRSIQVAQLEELSNFFGKRVIHYTDSTQDCDEFKRVRAKNYFLHCVKPFIFKFPYQAKVSHPSSFGHYQHALNIKKILLKQNDKVEKIYFEDDEVVYSTTNIVDAKGVPINFDNFGVFTGKYLMARLGKNWGYKNRTGRLQTYNHDKVITEDKKSFLIGFYLEGITKANSLFIKIEASQSNRNLLHAINFEYIKGISNVFFLKVPGFRINHVKNKIYFSKNSSLHFPMNFFFKKVQGEKTISYEPKYPSYKMIIEKKVSALSFLKRLKGENIKIIMNKVQ